MNLNGTRPKLLRLTTTIHTNPRDNITFFKTNTNFSTFSFLPNILSYQLKYENHSLYFQFLFQVKLYIYLYSNSEDSRRAVESSYFKHFFAREYLIQSEQRILHNFELGFFCLNAAQILSLSSSLLFPITLYST